ncbi:unnamed protein product [Rhodiola kirilowii]
MSREGSHHDYQDDDEMNLYGRNNEVPLPFMDDPEQLIRSRRARDREGIRRNQEPPEDRNAAGPVRQPPRYPTPPQPRQVPRREPAFDDYYGDNNNYRTPTMGELNAPEFETQPWCICQSPELENIVVDINKLPRFSGTNEESATTHLQRLHGICQNLKPNRVNINDFKLKAFYFSLVDSASDWFLSLPSGSIRTWVQMQRKFLDKYCPATKTMQVRRQLQDIRQEPNETMYDYLEKFNRLERSCCTLGLPEKLSIEYLINGLTKIDKMFLDALAGGSMMNLSLNGIRNLITNVAENARFREETTRQDEFFQTKNVSLADASVNSMPEEMKQLKEMMIQILRRQPVPVKPCEFCGSADHKTDACPTLIKEEPAEVNAVGEYQEYNKNQQEPTKSLDDTIKELAGSINQLGTSLHQHQEKTDGAISELTKQISQLAASVSTLTNESGRLLSQTIQMQEDVNALTLRSGKTLVGKPLEQEDKDPRLPGKEQMRPESLEALEEEAADEDDVMYEEEQDVTEEERDTSKEHIPGPVPRTEDPRISAKLPFPVPARMQKQHVMDEDVFELFSKVEINIPLLEAIKQIPRIENCMLDLGASINVLPFSIYSCLKIGPLKPTGLTIQLADRSCK